MFIGAIVKMYWYKQQKEMELAEKNAQDDRKRQQLKRRFEDQERKRLQQQLKQEKKSKSDS